MSETSIERVQHDLDVMKSALTADFPYDRGDVVIATIVALCGIPIGLREVPGCQTAMNWALFVILGCGLLASIYRWTRHSAERGIRPRRWAWNRKEALWSIIAVLGAVAYVILVRGSAVAEHAWNYAAWRERLAGPTLFAFGVAFLAMGANHWERRSWIGWGVALLATGAAASWITSRSDFAAFLGVAFTLGGLTSAAILWWQVRQSEAKHVGD